MIQTNLSLKWKQKTDIEKSWVTKGKWVGRGKELEVGISRCKLLCRVWINNKVLLYSTGHYIQYPVMNCDGKEDQFSSVAQSCLILCDPMNLGTPASLSITNARSLHKLMSIESVMPSNHLILCRPLLLLPPIPPSIRVFSNESTLHMKIGRAHV